MGKYIYRFLVHKFFVFTPTPISSGFFTEGEVQFSLIQNMGKIFGLP